MKAILIGTGIVLAVLLAVVVIWRTSIDTLVARGIEHYGSEVLGTSVTVGSVRIVAAEGRGTIQGLRVAQPAGYGDGDAVTVEEITLDFDAASILDQPLVIELVRVAMPRVFFIMNADRSNNLAVLQQNAEQWGAEEEAAPPPEETEARRIRIDRLEIEGGRIEADLSALKLGMANASLPPVRQNAVGGSAGLPPGEIAEAIANRFIAHTLTTVAASTIGRRLNQLIDAGAGEVRNLLDSLFPR